MSSKKQMPSWVTNAYKTTNVNWAQSQAAIYNMLGDLNIYEVRFTNLKDKFALEFIVQIDDKPRAVRIAVPVKYQGDNDKKRTQELNRIHRVLLYHLKAKFIAIHNNLTEFEEEFMAHLVLTDSNGNSRTVGEMMLPQYRDAIDSGKATTLRLLPSTDE